jgi:hypothetical protein
MRTCLQCGQKTDLAHCPDDGMATIVEGVHPSNAALTPNSVFAGRYRIGNVLGRGGMGTVYSAQHTGTGQTVAIKTLLLDSDADPGAAQRFYKEARLTAGLQHPNTIRVFDFGQSDEGVFFLAMECLRGDTLADRLARYKRDGKRMSQEETVEIAVPVLRSLGEAHRVGLVHRDLKPANIFLHEIDGAETVVKVLDFGIAKTADSSLTRTGTSLGTPSYMSPEQVMGQPIDGRSDLYALGIVLYGCVAAELPFQADSTYSMMMKQVGEAPPDLRNLPNLGVTSEFAQIVEIALAKRPADRFSDATAMRQALESLGTSPAVQPTAVPAAAMTAPPPFVPASAPAAAPAPPPYMPPPPASRSAAASPLSAPPAPRAAPVARPAPAAPPAAPPRPAATPPTSVVAQGPARPRVAPATPPPSSLTVGLVMGLAFVVLGGVVTYTLYSQGVFGPKDSPAAADSAAVEATAPATAEAPATPTEATGAPTAGSWDPAAPTAPLGAAAAAPAVTPEPAPVAQPETPPVQIPEGTLPDAPSAGIAGGILGSLGDAQPAVPPPPPEPPVEAAPAPEPQPAPEPEVAAPTPKPEVAPEVAKPKPKPKVVKPKPRPVVPAARPGGLRPGSNGRPGMRR